MNEVTNEQATTANNSKNNLPMIAIGIIVLLALVAGGYYYWKNNHSEGTPSPAGDNAAILGLNDSGPVAKVDGVEITREDYRRGVDQLIAAYKAQGIDTTSAEAATAVKNQVVTTLVNRQLVLGAAIKAGISIDDAAVETEYQKVLTNVGGAEQLASALASVNSNETELRADLKDEATINKYLADKVGINNLSVTDTEISTYYENAKATSASGTPAIPPLEEVKDVIKNQLVAEKQQQAINGELEKLRGEASIETLI